MVFKENILKYHVALFYSAHFNNEISVLERKLLYFFSYKNDKL